MWDAPPSPLSQSPPPQSIVALSRAGSFSSSFLVMARSEWAKITKSFTSSRLTCGFFHDGLKPGGG